MTEKQLIETIQQYVADVCCLEPDHLQFRQAHLDYVANINQDILAKIGDIHPVIAQRLFTQTVTLTIQFERVVPCDD